MTAGTLSCAHCLAEIPPGGAVRGEIDGREASFCCAGCRAIRAILGEEGLDRFYERRRGWVPGPPEARTIDPDLFSAAAREEGDALEIDLSISGIRCASCAWVIEQRLAKKDGVVSARVNYATHRARVRWDPRAATAGRIAEWIAELGYSPAPFEPGRAEESHRRERNDLLLRFGTAAFLSSQVMMYTAGLYAGYFQGMERQYRTPLGLIAMALATPVVFYSGFPFLKGAVAGLRRLSPGMDTLVFLGSFSAYAYSVAMIAAGGEVYFDTATMIVTLVLLGRYLEAAARSRASETIARLVVLAPGKARRVRGGGAVADGPRTETVPVSALEADDVIEVIPGERIAADGRVAEGSSEADESMLTGEAAPVPKGPGSRVYAGTLNGGGRLLVEVTGTGKETLLSRIAGAVEEAQARKAPVQGIADRVVAWFVPAVVVVALLTFVYWTRAGAPAVKAVLTSISVLVVACPCALGLAVPLAVCVGASAARDAGIMVRGGDVLEAGSKVRTVFLDKTGTLTAGRPGLTDVVPFGVSRDDVLGIASSLEASSEHAIAKAIRRAAGPEDPPRAADFRARPGMGVEGTVGGRRYRLGRPEFLESPPGTPIGAAARGAAAALATAGKTVVWLGDETRVVGLLAVVDAIRPEAPECVRRLKEDGYDVRMVTGDCGAAAGRIAEEAGIDRVLSRVTPVGKAELVRGAVRGGASVLMAGDGINDAPALAEAGVGVAMGRGTDVALESADAVLMTDDLLNVHRLLALSRRTMRAVRRNLWWAFSYNIVAIPLAAAGAFHPVLSAGLMAASSLVVVANSLRLRAQVPGGLPARAVP